MLDWHGPDETRTYYLDISNDGGFVRIIEDEDAYSLVSTCEFSEGGVKDWDTVANSIAFEDANGDGYDDLSVTDMDGGDLIKSIFLYDPEAVGFTYSEELSGFTAGQWGNNALTYDSWQDAYADVVMVWEGDHADDELHGYKLIYLNNDGPYAMYTHSVTVSHIASTKGKTWMSTAGVSTTLSIAAYLHRANGWQVPANM